MLVALAVVALAAIDALYLALIRSQGGAPSDTPWVVPFVAGYLLLMALDLAASLLVPPSARVLLRAGASAGLLVLGVLSAFSIGAVVLIAAGLATAATVLGVTAKPGGRAALAAGAGAIASVVILLGGFQVVWSHVVCQPAVQSGGSTAGLFGGSSYECNSGVLTYP